MQCFTHSTASAIGVCKHCFKGLCVECASDLGFGLACKGTHEAQVTDSSEMVSRAVKLNATNSPAATRYLTPAFVIALGLMFLVYGYMNPGKPWSLGNMMAAICLVYGSYLAVIIHRSYSR